MHRRGAGWRPAVNAKRIFRPQFIPPSDSLVFATFHTTCLPSLYPLPLTKEGQVWWKSRGPACQCSLTLHCSFN